MNKYLGKKLVTAVAMTRTMYNDYRGWQLPEDERHLKDEMGYLVEYADGGRSNDPRHEGYISWSPEDVFNKSYTPYNTWLERLEHEQAELQEKLNALDTALNVQQKPEMISETQWVLMSRQQFHMRMYNQILLDRIAEAKGEVGLLEIVGKEQVTGSEDTQ
ncbi:hypothetical protein [Acinetobacter sp. YH12211]|uniref:crAss001_48 related protein n=1 Tax=Acinetobacter sp. YH12211 TaxID=2601147 RepID=UPI0015D36B81|nr:hypothetical protein [Acinetobacter sp. YH12211]